jgi:hypothetical protein
MPTPAGYSGTPLVKKLGFREDMTFYLANGPEHYFDLVGTLPAGVKVLRKLQGSIEFIHLFATQSSDLSARLPKCLARLTPDGTIWVSWPKKASKVPTDITEDVIRDIALPLGLVDVKVCAVDEVWSGLKLVIRKELRGSRS